MCISYIRFPHLYTADRVSFVCFTQSFICVTYVYGIKHKLLESSDDISCATHSIWWSLSNPITKSCRKLDMCKTNSLAFGVWMCVCKDSFIFIELLWETLYKKFKTKQKIGNETRSICLCLTDRSCMISNRMSLLVHFIL